jgi:3-oxoacyl-[acyl-carrier protein] reductase
VAVVTGAAQGIGLSIARIYLCHGASVLLADLNYRAVKQAATRLGKPAARAVAWKVDVSDSSSAKSMVQAVLDQFGRVDILVNCAGIDSPMGRAWEEADKSWRRIIDVDLNGSWWPTRHVIPHMITAGGGRIIFISSVAAREWSGTHVAYNAAKAGLIGLAVALASELEPHSILVNAVMPGPTGDTGRPLSDVERAGLESRMPLGLRGADPIAQACLYLAQPSGDWITGTVLNVSGGYVKG